MEIQIRSLLRGAQEAEGTVIIIDVFRAFTTAAIAFWRGAEKIILVAEVEEALELRKDGLGEICLGEVNGVRPRSFDFGNSPFEISQADVRGKTLIQSTRAGTVGASAAIRAEKLYASSLVIADATVKSILKAPPNLVTIVPMGVEGRVRADEDEQCALYIRNLLQGRQPDHKAVRHLICAGEESQKYGDPVRPQFHPEDKKMALQIDSLAFAIRIGRESNLLIARRIPV